MEPQSTWHTVLCSVKQLTLQTGGVLWKVQKCGRHHGVPRYRNGERHFEECCFVGCSLVLRSRFDKRTQENVWRSTWSVQRKIQHQLCSTLKDALLHLWNLFRLWQTRLAANCWEVRIQTKSLLWTKLTGSFVTFLRSFTGFLHDWQSSSLHEVW